MAGRKPRIGLFGGSFDPPHVGHLLLAAYASAVADLDRLLVVPCPDHPLGKELTAWEHRLAMCRLAFEDLRRTEVSDIEKRLGPPVRTFRTIQALRKEHPDHDVVLLIGSDILGETESWYHWTEIEKTTEIFVVGRGLCPDREVCLPPVSSTEIRRRLQAAESVEGLLPTRVMDYIRRHDLYGLT